MKIENEKIVRFLKKVNMQGTEVLDEAIFNFTDEGLIVGGRLGANLGQVYAILKKEDFIEYEAIKEIGVQEISKIITIIKTFDKEVEFNVIGNLLEIKSGSRKVEIELLNIEMLNCISEEDIIFLEKIKNGCEETYTISAIELKKFIMDASMNEDPTITLTTEKNKLILSNSGKYKFQNTILAEGAEGKTKVSFKGAIANCTANLTDNLTISSKSDYPIRIFEKTDESEVTIVIAPNVKKD